MVSPRTETIVVIVRTLGSSLTYVPGVYVLFINKLTPSSS